MPLSSKVSGWEAMLQSWVLSVTGAGNRACSLDLLLSLGVKRGVLNPDSVIPCSRGEIETFSYPSTTDE